MLPRFIRAQLAERKCGTPRMAMSVISGPKPPRNEHNNDYRTLLVGEFREFAPVKCCPGEDVWLAKLATLGHALNSEN
jgi:hypothetical protein